MKGFKITARAAADSSGTIYDLVYGVNNKHLKSWFVPNFYPHLKTNTAKRQKTVDAFNADMEDMGFDRRIT